MKKFPIRNPAPPNKTPLVPMPLDIGSLFSFLIRAKQKLQKCYALCAPFNWWYQKVWIPFLQHWRTSASLTPPPHWGWCCRRTGRGWWWWTRGSWGAWSLLGVVYVCQWVGLCNYRYAFMEGDTHSKRNKTEICSELEFFLESFTHINEVMLYLGCVNSLHSI